MTADELDERLAQLGRDLERERDERRALQRRYEGFEAKIVRGSKFLVDLEYRLLYEGTITATAGTNTLGPIFDTLPGALHAAYLVSAYSATAAVPVVTDGASPGFAALHVGVTRTRQASPVRVEVRVNVVNLVGADHVVAVRVWRRLGIGS